MFENPSQLSCAEIKALLLARCGMQEREQKTLLVRFRDKVGGSVNDETNPQNIEMVNKMREWSCGTMAERMALERRTDALISASDFTNFASWMVYSARQAQGNDMDGEELLMVNASLKAIFENVRNMLSSIVPEGSTEYDENWKWVRVVLKLGEERGIAPDALIRDELAYDEITRRYYTRERFIALQQVLLAKVSDVHFYKDMIVQALRAGGMSDEEQKEAMDEVEKEVLPKLRSTMQAYKQVAEEWLDEEIARIYG